MVDAAKLSQLLARLEAYVAVLRDLAMVPRSEFLANRDKVGSAKYHFVVAIEACIDIANHIIASQNFRVPKDNADSFAVLIEQGIIPLDRKDILAAMARFRNRLVHLYWEVDDERVHEYLSSRLNELDVFARTVARWLFNKGPA